MFKVTILKDDVETLITKSDFCSIISQALEREGIIHKTGNGSHQEFMDQFAYIEREYDRETGSITYILEFKRGEYGL